MRFRSTSAEGHPYEVSLNERGRYPYEVPLNQRGRYPYEVSLDQRRLHSLHSFRATLGRLARLRHFGGTSL